ncbi:MAG: hypothetical protein Q4E60_11025 [Bacteroidales bacterium]|nr:hypothetical protein [Bacteroidales bacterium]
MKKKYLVLLSVMFLLFSKTSLADVIVTDINKEKGGSIEGGPRTVEPAINVTTNGDIINVGVCFYAGNVDVTIVSTVSGSQFTNSYPIDGNGIISIDTSAMESGLYYICFSFGNNLNYTGYFEVE